MFSQACVIPSVHGGKGLPEGGLHPGGSAWEGLPRGSASGGWEDPHNQILWDMVKEWAVCILLECILVLAKFTV